MSYNCIVSKIDKISKHSNADRLNLASILGYQVIVGLDAKEGDIGLLFPDDGQLSPIYAESNSLLSYKDEQGNKKGGYFDQNRRVRAQKFRGEKSEAYFAPLSSLTFTGYDITKLQVGDRFAELNGIPICNKYINEKTRLAANQKNKKSLKEKKFTKEFNRHLKEIFPEHFDTNQFRQYSDKIPYGSLITITSKNHGTSARTAYIPVLNKPNFLQKLFNFVLLKNEPKFTYNYVNGTRRVILTKDSDDGYYHGTNFRDNCLERLKGKLNKNEILYYEIVGYTDTGGSIMPSVNTSKLKDKAFTKRFGPHMVYRYGCLPGTCEMYVYRIAVVNPDGEIEELSWNRVKHRCEEMGIKHVPEIEQFIYTEDIDLRGKVEYYTDEVDIADSLDPSHIREGVCVRVDDPNGKLLIYKNKSLIFKIMEGIVKDSGEPDMEEVEDLQAEGV